MQLHQLQVVFDAAEDRLLFRVSTTDQQEFRAWLTRRFIKLLWPHLVKSIETKVAVKTPMPDARREVMGFEHEKAVKETDFSKPFDAAAERALPLGAAPFVVTQGNIQRDQHGNHAVTLNPAQGQGMSLAFDDRLMHSFCKLLDTAVRQAEWDMRLMVSPEEVAAAQTNAGDANEAHAPIPKRLLN